MSASMADEDERDERDEADARDGEDIGFVGPDNAVNSGAAARPVRRRRSGGLSFKLLLLTIMFVMISEVLIYVPSIANFRINWLEDAHNTASVAAAVLTDGAKVVDPTITNRLLASSETLLIAYRQGNRRQLLAHDMPPTDVDKHVRLGSVSVLTSVVDAFETLFAPPGRLIRVVATPASFDGEVEVIIEERKLRHDMIEYSKNILILSLVISIITAGCVYVTLRRLFVQPIRRLTDAFEIFAEDPEDATRIIRPSGRNDEIGEAEVRLAAMQAQLSGTIHQRRRLADLGLAVSKINHDLRNLLAAAQLFSDSLLALPDPTVQRFVPKIIRALDRAVGYTQSVMSYGKAGEAAPVRRLIRLRRLVDEVGEMLGLAGHPTIDFANTVPDDVEVDADPDQLYRVLMNLCRNAAEALESDPHEAVIERLAIHAEREGGVVVIHVADTGPGIPAAIRSQIFQPFRGSMRQGGTGLGLAITAELIRAHGGSIELVETGTGTCFRIEIPDRPVDIASRRQIARM